MSKKVDWDFRFIMTVLAATILFGIWICFQAYPAECAAVLNGIGTALPAVALLIATVALVVSLRHRAAVKRNLARQGYEGGREER